MKRDFLQLIFVLIIMIIAVTGKAQEISNSRVDTISPKVEEVKTDLNIFKSDFEIFRRLKISGYVQGQFQLAEEKGIKSYEGGDFSPISDKRFMVRRGRVKVAYETEITQFAIQIDATEKGVSLKDAYASFREPWLKMFGLKVGVFDRPFGYEIGYSSSLRESPERGRMSQILFPGERDLGAMLTINPWKTSRFNGIKLDA